MYLFFPKQLLKCQTLLLRNFDKLKKYTTVIIICKYYFFLPSFFPSFFLFFFLSLFILLSSLNLVHHLVFKMVYSWVYLGTKQLSDLPQGYTAEQVLERNSKTVSFVINSQLFTTTTRPYHLPQGMHKAQWVVLHKNVIKSWKKLLKLQAMLGTDWAKHYWHASTVHNYSNTKTGLWVIEDTCKWLFFAVFLSAAVLTHFQWFPMEIQCDLGDRKIRLHF